MYAGIRSCRGFGKKKGTADEPGEKIQCGVLGVNHVLLEDHPIAKALRGRLFFVCFRVVRYGIFEASLLRLILSGKAGG
jgi:hypothetical protein